eukprot:COSAG03_NODE_50_length_16299_cov_20.189877_10_plen_545_part_00
MLAWSRVPKDTLVVMLCWRSAVDTTARTDASSAWVLLLAHVALCSLMSAVTAANPLLRDSGMADANLKYFAGQFLVFGTHDYASNDTHFQMRNWRVWRSQDAVSWVEASTVHPSNTLAWSTAAEQDECWATDAAFVNGSYFFYLSVGPSEIGVVTSTTVAGPWHDPLGKPLLTAAMVPPSARDPCVFADDDGSYYIIAGVFNYRIARLNPDMISLAEEPRNVSVNGAWGCCRWPTTPGASTADKPFLHKRNGTYYLSWGAFYGVSDSVYGPYEMGGNVIATAQIEPSFRTNTTLNASVWFLGNDYNDRHGSFLHYENQWLFVSNDRSQTQAEGDPKPQFYRDTVGCYVHFRANAICSNSTGVCHDAMEPCTINAIGIGEYDAAAPQPIEAENYFGAVGMTRQVDLRAEHTDVKEDGFAVEVTHGSVLRFPNVRNVDRSRSTFTLRLLSTGSRRNSAFIELRSGLDAASPLLSRIEIPAARIGVVGKGVGAFETLECDVDLSAVPREMDQHAAIDIRVEVFAEPNAAWWLDHLRFAGGAGNNQTV